MNARHVALAIACALALTSATIADLPYTRSAWIADLPPGAHDAQCVATIIDQRTIEIEHFTYDGGGPQVYFYLGETDSPSDFADGLQLDPLLTGTVYSDNTLTLTLPAGETLNGYTALSVWCAAVGVSFTSATFELPASLYPRAGWVAELPPGDHDTAGAVTIINDHLMFAESCSYDGTALNVRFYLGESNHQNAFQNGVGTEPALARPLTDADLVVWRPDPDNIDPYAAISVWCIDFNINFTSATFRPDLPGDLDSSGGIDGADLDGLSDCLAGPGLMPGPLMSVSLAECYGAFDQNEDVAVDLTDFMTIQAALD